MIPLWRLLKGKKKPILILIQYKQGFPGLHRTFTWDLIQQARYVWGLQSHGHLYQLTHNYAPSWGSLDLNSCIVLTVRTDKLPLFHVLLSRNKRLRCGSQERDFPRRNNEVLARSKMFEICHIKLLFLFPNRLHMPVRGKWSPVKIKDSFAFQHNRWGADSSQTP